MTAGSSQKVHIVSLETLCGPSHSALGNHSCNKNLDGLHSLVNL